MRSLRFPRTAFLILILIGYAQCSGNSGSTEFVEPTFIEAELSATVTPADDFYQYVNETWIGAAELPNGYNRWTIFDQLEAERDHVLFTVLTKTSQAVPYDPYSDEWKASEFFSIGMDSLLAENFGVQPIARLLSRIESIRSVNQLANFLIFQEGYQMGSFFSFDVKPDPRNGNRMGLYLEADELGLINPKNYLEEDEISIDLRRQYVIHIEKMFELAGLKSDTTVGSGVVKVETTLAKSTLSAEGENIEAGRNFYSTTEELGVLSPSINWSAYLSSMGFEQIDSVFVEHTGILQNFEAILSEESMKDIKSYLTWHVLRSSAPYLQHTMSEEKFNFDKFLDESTQRLSRKSRVLSSVNRYMGETVGKLYVEHSFPASTKKHAQRLVNTLKISFADRIKSLDWMNDSTKLIALSRLNTLRVKIGYPDSWNGYAGLIVDRGPELGSYWQNVMNGRLYEFDLRAEKLGQPLDSEAWKDSPQTVAVSYDSLLHELVVPAAILQRPIFDSEGDRASTYGAAGSLIAREMSKLMNPILDSLNSEEAGLLGYAGLRQNLISQYETLFAGDSIQVQGESVVDQGIADMAGLAVAFDGLNRSIREEGGVGENYQRRFIIGWARRWSCINGKDSLLDNVDLETSLPEGSRANIPLMNFDEFYHNYTIPAGSKMHIPDSLRVKIW